MGACVSLDRSDENPEPLLEAEALLLGCIFYDASVAHTVEGVLAPEMFLEPANAEVFRIAMEQVAHGRRPDMHAVADRLRDFAPFQELGGLRYLADAVDKAYTPAARDHARLIRDAYLRRSVTDLAVKLARAARENREMNLDEILGGFDEELVNLTASGADVEAVGADVAVAAMFERLNNPSKRETIPTGIVKIDRAFRGGLSPSHLILLAGRPSMGKSALASCIALNVAEHARWPDGKPVGVLEISAEMDVDQMTRRHIADMCFTLSPLHAPSYIDLKDDVDLSPDARTLAEVCGKRFARLKSIQMIHKPGLTLASLRGIIRRQAARWKRQGIRLGVVIVDHVGLMRDDGRSRSRYEAQTELAIGMKELAGTTKVALVALAQLSRQIEARDDKHPILNDLRDSGGWEENADAVVGLYRDSYYAERESAKKGDKGEHQGRIDSKDVTAVLLKMREGKTGRLELWGDMARNALRDAAPDNYYAATAGQYFADLLDPDVPLPPPVRSDPLGPSETVTPQGVAGGVEQAFDEPPLSAYGEDDFR